MQPETVAASDGNPILKASRGSYTKRALLLSIMALAAGVAAAFGLERWQYETFSGFLQARLRTVASARDAQVSEILATSGAVVAAGQPLVALKDPAFDARIEAKQREVESLEIELTQNEARLEVELEWRRKNIDERIFDAKLKGAQAVRQQLLAPPGIEASLSRHWEASPFSDSPLIEQTAGGDMARGAAVAAARSSFSEIELCSQHIEELERINRELPAKISRSMGVDMSRKRLENARGELARLEAQRCELTLLAESSGLVGVFQKEVGDHVAAHEAIVQLLDEEQPYLLLQIPSPRISDFAPGTVVELNFPGGKKGRGRVEEIPPQTSPIPGDHSQGGETVITAHVEPVGPLWPNLPFGSVVEVRRRR